jgi:hypothetical protein
VKVTARYLGSHQVHVVVESYGQEDVGFAHAGVALNIYVYPVALNELDSFQIRSAAEPACFFIDEGDLVASVEKRCYCS